MLNGKSFQEWLKDWSAARGFKLTGAEQDDITRAVVVTVSRERAKAVSNEMHSELCDIAHRAVVALHMYSHAGLNKPGCAQCREGLCGDWHNLKGPCE